MIEPLRDRAELTRHVRAIRAELAAAHPEWRAKIESIRLELSGRMTRSAGSALPRERVVRISAPIFLLPENAGELRETVIHEIAHVLAGPDARAHGALWRRIHHALGGRGGRTHQLRLPGSRRRRRPRVQHLVTCERCGDRLPIGPIRYRRLLRGSTYLHLRCGGRLLRS